MNKKDLPLHYIVSLTVLIAGLLNILTSLSLHIIPHIRLFEGIIPLYFKHTARTFTLLTGLFLVTLSFNMFRRKRRAWIFSTFFIITSIFLHLLRGFNIIEITFLVLLLSILLITRHAFEIESDKITAIRAVTQFFIVLILLFVYAFFGFYLFQGQFSNPVNINNIVADYLFSITGVGQEILIPLSRNALWFTDSISIVSIVIFFYSLALLFQPLIENTKITHQEKIRLRDLILHNGENSVSYFALMDDKQYFFNSSKTCVIAYKIRNGVALALGDPIGESKLERTYCIEQFVADNTKKDLKTAFYNTGESMSLIYEGLGYKSIKIGEEALIPTNTFTLNGSAMADVRHEVNKIKREQGIFAWYTMDTIPWKYVNEINSIHYAWTRQKKSLQLTYSLDYFPFPIEENAFIQIIKGQNERIWGILSYFPFNGGKGMVLDFMMRASGSPHGIIEAGINEAIEFFKARGIHFLSLGMAPLSDIDVKSENNVTQKAKNLIFENFNQFYQYKSLFKFKSKFNPLWLHKYLVYKNEIDLPAIIIAVAQAHLKEPLNIYNLLK